MGQIQSMGQRKKKRANRFRITLLFSYAYGAPGRSRTADRLVRSQVLYPAELRAL